MARLMARRFEGPTGAVDSQRHAEAKPRSVGGPRSEKPTTNDAGQRSVMEALPFVGLSPSMPAVPAGTGLAVRVLEALAGTRLPVLLALLLARVTREEASALERRTALRIGEDERSRDAVTHRLGLGAVPTAGDRRFHVVLIEHFDELE